MKEIKAYGRAGKVSYVALALHKIEALTGMSLSEVRGFGRCRSPQDNPSIVQDLVDYIPYARLEILCPDALEFEIVTTIQRAAFTGEPGDGKVFVTDLSKVIRIADGEHGEAAIQKQCCPKCRAREDAAPEAYEQGPLLQQASVSTPMEPTTQEEL